jgi:hypothetical protein
LGKASSLYVKMNPPTTLKVERPDARNDAEGLSAHTGFLPPYGEAIDGGVRLAAKSTERAVAGLPAWRTDGGD